VNQRQRFGSGNMGEKSGGTRRGKASLSVQRAHRPALYTRKVEHQRIEGPLQDASGAFARAHNSTMADTNGSARVTKGGLHKLDFILGFLYFLCDISGSLTWLRGWRTGRLCARGVQ
jgi:hypothetical protein